jgi:gluconate 2-dehydrogenase gamma chain
MKRREFFVVPAKTLGGLLVFSLANEPMLLGADEKEMKVPLRFFTAAEALTVAAACERIFPSDENGPGAKEAGVVIYIDRQLGGPYGRDQYRYTKAPWIESVPEHGYQGRATPREIYREGIAGLGADFAQLDAARQIEKLEAIERSMFFQMLRTHTIEGMFCDPMHGGNAGMIGWQMTGYPGPLMSFREDLEKYRGVPYPRKKPKSLEQIVGRKVKPWEDEA